MNNNNNNSNDDKKGGGGGLFSFFFKNSTPKISPQLQQERTQIYDNFASIVKSKFNNSDNVQKLDTVYNNSTGNDDYEVEKKKMTEMNNNGLTKGLAAGLCTFAFLRLGPGVMARYVIRRRAAAAGGGGGYKFDAPQSPIRSPFDNTASKTNVSSGGGGATNTNNNQGNMEYKPSLFLRALKFSLDITVSIAISIYASAIFTDKQKLLKDASEIPLVEGRSLVSDELCLDFRREYSLYDKQVWERHEKEDVIMGAIRDFVVNCRKRNRYEEQIREESGMIKGEDVSIPSPGVPVDLDVSDMEGESEEDILGSRNSGKKENAGGDERQMNINNDEEYFDSQNKFELGDDDNDSDGEKEEHGETWDSIKDFDDGSKGTSDYENGATNDKPRRGWGW